MPTPTVGGRLKSAFIVLSAFDEFQHRMLRKLSDRPAAGDQEPPDFGELLGSLGGQLTWACDHVRDKDKGYIFESSGDSKYLTDRDVKSRDLGRVISRTKTMFDGCYQPVRIEEYGFPREIARDPEILLQQGLQLDGRLREPALPLPEPIAESLKVDPVVLADVVKPWVEALDQSLVQVRRERRKLQLASLERNEALHFFDRTFLWVSRTAESLFNLAGEEELAKRVRPSLTRPGRTERDPDEILAETGQEPPDFDSTEPGSSTTGRDASSDTASSGAASSGAASSGAAGSGAAGPGAAGSDAAATAGS